MASSEWNRSKEAEGKRFGTIDVEPLQPADPFLGTQHDIVDMRRLGKKQELMVWTQPILISGTLTEYLVAEFPLYIYPGLYIMPDVHMGSAAGVWFTLTRTNVMAKSFYSVAYYGLINGGTAGFIYTFIFSACGLTVLVASMADMASMLGRWLRDLRLN